MPRVLRVGSARGALHHLPLLQVERAGLLGGDVVRGHLVRGEFITNRSVQKGGTGRLLHLFG